MMFLHEKITKENIKAIPTEGLKHIGWQIKKETHGLMYSAFLESRQDKVIRALNIISVELSRRTKE